MNYDGEMKWRQDLYQLIVYKIQRLISNVKYLLAAHVNCVQIPQIAAQWTANEQATMN